MKSRLHLYPHSGPNTRGYIVGEPAALRSLARHLEDAARSAAGFDTVRYYGSDGHEYELVIACDVDEQEWQQMRLPLDALHQPLDLAVVKTYDELRKELDNKK